MGQESTKHGETAMSSPGACEAEAALPRLVGQVVTHKHEGKPFTSMQGEASGQGDPRWRFWVGDSTFWRTTMGRSFLGSSLPPLQVCA